MSEHASHHDDPWSHVPPPSPWPVLFTGSLCVAVFGTLANMFESGFFWNNDSLVMFVGIFLSLFTLMGWGHQIIKEKAISHDLDQQQSDLKLFTLMFFVSEALAFGTIFGYYYIRAFATVGFVRPDDIHLGGWPVAVATILLITSSLTCEFAHKAVEHGRKSQARLLLLLTITLGFIFLYAQGKEYGELIIQGFWPGNYEAVEYNAFSSLFYISTGFHGVHVATGLLMLILVWLRMELGHFTQKRHFSVVAASWYWHFVDVVWVLLFISIYVMVK